VSPGGLGLETARAIALQSPKLVILAGRSPSKVQEAETIVNNAAPNTPTRRLILDLASMAKARIAAEEINNSTEIQSIDVVINNAGIMARPYELTEDGIESQFGANHIGHFLFTQLIMPKILAAGKNARIVNLSSNGYKAGGVRFDDWNFDVSYRELWE
jgi:NAD(P)-dependent dehydrogenase (short-subunit alcohol dehydrogenase family)